MCPNGKVGSCGEHLSLTSQVVPCHLVKAGYATAGQRPEGGKQHLNAVSEPSNQNKDPQDAIPAVSHSVSTDYHLQGTIEGVPARFIVDTGATTSILNKNIWDRLNQQNSTRSLMAATDKKLVGVESSPLKVLGMGIFSVVFEQQHFNVNFLVADSLTIEAILGRDFLRDNHCVIDLRLQA